jgi:hypothetical protein
MKEFLTPTVKVRIVKLPPAPIIDGHDVREYRAGLIGEIHAVPEPLARYLVAAGYAEYVTPLEQAADRGRKAAPK